MTFNITVHVNGPAFDQRDEIERRVMLQRAVDAVAREGKNYVVGHLVTFIRKPTPFYWTQIAVQPVRPHYSKVWDQLTTEYGPWLEGVSKRNASTRFKGYHAFRKQTQRLTGDVPRIAEPAVDEYVREMNA